MEKHLWPTQKQTACYLVFIVTTSDASPVPRNMEFFQKWNSLEGAQNIVQMVPGAGTQQQAWELLFAYLKKYHHDQVFLSKYKTLGEPLTKQEW